MFFKKTAPAPKPVRYQAVTCQTCGEPIEIRSSLQANVREISLACPKCGRRHLYSTAELKG